MLRCNEYELRVLQEAAVGGCNGGRGGYNVGGYNVGGYNVGGYYGSGSFNVGGYAVVVYSALHKQLCWEFGVSHNCVCIISEGPSMYAVTCLETPCSQKILLIL